MVKANLNASPAVVRAQMGIDCGITAAHQCELIEYLEDGSQRVKRKKIPPAAAGIGSLIDMIKEVGVRVDVVAEPTSMTWGGIQAAVQAAGGRFFLLGTKHSARLRAAVAGKNKSDVIDAHLLVKSFDLFDLEPVSPAPPGQEALKRLALARGDARKHLDQCWRRLRSCVRATTPDLDKIMSGSRTRMLAILGRWPDLLGLARAQLPTLVPILRAHSYCRGNHEQIAQELRQGAQEWVQILTPTYDLDLWATKVEGLITDINAAQSGLERYTTALLSAWREYYENDTLLMSIPGVGPITAATIRGWLGDGSQFPTAANFASYCGFTPSNWSSGAMEHKRRAITKEGPSALRMAVFLAANAARSSDPQLAAMYHHLMVDLGHHHNKAVCAIARKLAERIWVVIRRGHPYEYRSNHGTVIGTPHARTIVRNEYRIPDSLRAKHRTHTSNQRRARLTT